MLIPYGVYIGKDIEVVSMEKYMLVYRRMPDKRQLESLLIDQDLACIGICQTVSSGISQMMHDLLDKKIDNIREYDKALRVTFADNTVKDIGMPPDNVKSALLEKDITHLSHHDGAIRIHYQGGRTFTFTPPEQIQWKHALLSEKTVFSDEETKSLLNQKPFTIDADNDTLKLCFADALQYSAKSHELFTMEDLQPPCPTSKEASIGECLQTWNVGYIEMRYDGCFSGVIVNTWKHMYIFEITNGSIYCRAARYAACNEGVVFNQNFRQGYEAYMIEDNQAAMEELVYDKSLFSADACVWSGRSVYWSTYRVSDNEIELHGCQGDVYTWSRPNR